MYFLNFEPFIEMKKKQKLNKLNIPYAYFFVNASVNISVHAYKKQHFYCEIWWLLKEKVLSGENQINKFACQIICLIFSFLIISNLNDSNEYTRI